MPATLTIAELRRHVASALSDDEILLVIDQEEAEAIRRFGAPGDGTTSRTTTHPGGTRSIYLPAPAVSVSAVTEADQPGDTAGAVATDRYYLWGAEGRLERLPRGARWGAVVAVTWVPVDVRARWRSVLIELCRLAIEQTAMRAESVAGEYSYQADDWDAARQKQYRRLTFMGV